jgi:hypothetical protein
MTNLVGHRITLTFEVEKTRMSRDGGYFTHDTIVERSIRQEYALPTEPFHQLRELFDRNFAEVTRDHDKQLGLFDDTQGQHKTDEAA